MRQDVFIALPKGTEMSLLDWIVHVAGAAVLATATATAFLGL
jgi:hypothetical protein